MAERRSTVRVEVLGTQDLKTLNETFTRYATRVQKIIDLHGQLEASDRRIIAGTNAMTAAQGRKLIQIERANNALLKQIATNTQAARSTDAVASSHDRLNQSLLKTAIQYRTISLVFHQAVQTITQMKDEIIELDRQTARVQRVLGRGARPEITAGISGGVTRYGAKTADAGEAAYQIAAFERNPVAAMKMLDSTLKLVIGTEADARESARLSMQMLNLYGDQFTNTADRAEKYRRIQEMLGLVWKGSQTEINELLASYKYLSSAFESMKVPLPEQLLVLQYLDLVGGRASQAGTGLNNLIEKIAEFAGKSEHAMSDLFVKTKDGGVGVIKTLENIASAAKAIYAKEGVLGQEAFLKSLFPDIRGLRQARSFIAAYEKFGGDAGKAAAAALNEGFEGGTRELDKIVTDRMDNIGDQMSRAWGGALQEMSRLFLEFDKSIHLTGFFRDIGDVLERGPKIRQYLGLETPDDKLSRDQLVVRRELLERTLHWAERGGHRPTTAAESLAVERTMLGGRFGTYDLKPSSIRAKLRELDDRMEADWIAEGERERKLRLYGPGGLHVETPESLTPEARKTLERIKRDKQRKAAAEAEKRQREADEKARAEAARLTRLAEEAEKHARNYVEQQGRSGIKLSDYERGIVNDLNYKASKFRERADKLRVDPRGSVDADRLRDIREGLATSDRQIDEAGLKLALDRAKSLYDQGKEGSGGRELATGVQRAEYDYYRYLAKASPSKLDRDRAQLELWKMNRGMSGTLSDYDEARRREFGALSKTDELQEWTPPHTGARPPSEILEEMRSRPGRGFRGGSLEWIDLLRVSEVEKLRLKQEQMRTAIPKLEESLALSEFFQNPAEIDDARAALDALSLSLEQVGRAAEDAAAQSRNFDREYGAGSSRSVMDEREFEFGLTQRPVPRHLQYRYEQARNREERAMLEGFQNDPVLMKGMGSSEQINLRRRIMSLDAGFRFNTATRTLEERESTRRAVVDAGMAFARGDIGIGGMARNIGQTIGERALEEQLLKWTDPLVIGLTNATTTQERLITATDSLTSVMMGGSPSGGGSGGRGGRSGPGGLTGIAGAVAAGVAFAGANGKWDYVGPPMGGGGSAGGGIGGGTRLNRNMKKWQTGDFLGAGMAAYSTYSNAAEQGVTLGGVLGGAAQGYAMGGPVGGIIGGAISLIGGIFGGGRKKSPQEENFDRNPAFSNAPSNFIYDAYRYRLTGQLPDRGLGANAAPPPIVHVTLIQDGVKTAVKTVLAEETGRSNTSQAAVYMDFQGPV